MKFDCEATDTFSGQANYCWVKRATLDLPDDANDLKIVRAAKSALGYTGVKCRRDDIGDMIVLRPVGLLQVIFITPCY